MSIGSFLTSSAALYRPSGGPSSSGGNISAPFQVVTGYGAMACSVWPRGSSMVVSLGQSAIKGDYVIAFIVNPMAAAGDKLVIAGTAYLVNGSMTYSSPVVSSETLYLIYADLWTRS